MKNKKTSPIKSWFKETNFYYLAFEVIIVILIVTSLMAFVIIHLELAKVNFHWSSKGLNNYLSKYGDYKALFTGTVASIAAYLGLLRLKVAAEANQDKNKQDRFNEWKHICDIRMVEIEKCNPIMKREFIRLRYKLFEQLHTLNFIVNSKIELENVFKIFLNSISFFEENNEKYIALGGIYPNADHSYTFEDFRFIFIGTIDNYYSEIYNDIRKMYIDGLKGDRIIDKIAYVNAMNLPKTIV